MTIDRPVAQCAYCKAPITYDGRVWRSTEGGSGYTGDATCMARSQANGVAPHDIERRMRR